MKINYQKELNEEQYEVVTGADGYSLVLAGAGSGKTRAITYRVAYLLDQKKAAANEILLMTFTNKAAKEMLHRVSELLDDSGQSVLGGTFHRLGNLFLRQHIHLLGYKPDFNILDQDDSQRLINSTFTNLNINIKKDALPPIGMIQHMISYANNTRQTLDEVMSFYDVHWAAQDKINAIAKAYQSGKKQNNAVDFDDLLSLWLEILEQYPSVAENSSKKYKYVLVDEYQDVNYIQAQLVKYLGKENKNILAVGDDAQSIYSFRAADVNNILSFAKDYPNAKIFKLEKNYRSSPEILALAESSIMNNDSQYRKRLEAMKDSSSQPQLVKMLNPKKQAIFVAQTIRELHQQGYSYSSIAILARSVYQTIDIQLALSNYNIPYSVRGGQKYFEQAQIKDLLSFVRVLYNFNDTLAWQRILALADGIGEKQSQAIIDFVTTQDSLEVALGPGFIPKQKKAQRSWEDLKTLLHDAKFSFSDQDHYNLAGMIKYLYESFYRGKMRDLYTEDFSDREEAVEQFIDFASNYKDLRQFLSDVCLDEELWQANKQKEMEDDFVLLSTIHQSKGLEWSVVFVSNLYQGAFPHYKSLDNQKEVQEERRLFYVACTRAKEKLYLLFPLRSQHYMYGEVMNERSQFIEEIPEDLYIESSFTDSSFM